MDKLTPETALYWRVLVEFLTNKADDDIVDQLRPELTPYCDYVRTFILSNAASSTSSESNDDDLNWEFVAKELIVMCASYDLADDVGRRNLARLIKDLLISRRVTSSLIPQLVVIFTRVEKQPQSRIDQIAEVIAELKDPMSRESDLAIPPPPITNVDQSPTGAESRDQSLLQQTVAAAENNVDHKLIRKLQLENAKLLVELTTSKDEQWTAIAEQDFFKAEQLKQTMAELEAKRAQNDADIAAEQAKAIP